MQTAAVVASYILRVLQEEGNPTSNLKLQKLLYYCQGWHLAIFGDPLFPDRLEAWVHGPVQPDIYKKYMHNRWAAIADHVAYADLPPIERAFVDKVLKLYGRDHGDELEKRTCSEAPWRRARGDIPRDQESDAVISHESMMSFFRAFM